MANGEGYIRSIQKKGLFSAIFICNKQPSMALGALIKQLGICDVTH
jgi:hypothetical protein